MRLSLKWKMGLVLAVLLILTVAVLSELVLRGIEQNQQQRMEEQLEKQSQVAAQYVRQNYMTGDERLSAEGFMGQSGRRMALYLAMLSGMPTALYDSTGKETGSSLQTTGSVDYKDTLAYALQGKVAYQTSGDSVTYFAPIYEGEKLLGAVQLHYSMVRDHLFIKEIRNLFRTAGMFALGGGFLIGYGYFYRVAAVIGKLRKASKDIREAAYLKKPPVRRRDELGDLGNDIFYMSGSIEAHIAGMKEEQRKLELAVTKLQALERQQKQFIGNISHEFKTPLTAIRAYIDLLSMYRDDPQLTEEAIGSMGKESERLYEMVDKVLRLSVLEKYDFEQQAEAVALDELLLDLAGRMRGKAGKFELRLDTELEQAVVWADRESLISIFVNLIDNAIKYNVPGGSIVIRLSHETGGDTVVSVEDTGIGIPEEAGDKIFEPFFTVNKDRSRQSGGTGLGLPIVKQLVEAQGGRLEWHSEPGNGTVFRIFFPKVDS
ncbi:sensor histidine kinase [Paenibacillus sp. NPDC058071]|uniref:sensor histidine kinase n=1 Tax=Paenibacillus sp. NPDC058071 TaxID=3346326 RepID=UPI0036DDD6F7